MGDLDLTPGQPKGSETILSEEMWEKILMNLKDPSDVLNGGKTCVQFQRILHSKTFEAYLAKTLPFLMDYLDRNSVLNCRKVSKGWRDVVDNCFENYFLGRTVLGPPKRLKHFPLANYYGALYLFGTRNYWNRNIDHERFMREMKDHPRNPFIGRAVYFELTAEEGEEDRQEFQTIYNFFEMFGKDIWTLQLEISQGYPIPVEREDIFRFIIKDVFELAPNLKNLYIKTVPLLKVSMRKNEIRALAPAPALEKLEISEAFSEYHGHDEDYEIIEKAILLRHSNSQLRVLHIKTLDLLRIFNIWPNLKELHFTSIKRINELDVVLRNLRLPNLELLSISLGHMTIPNYKEWLERGQKMTFKKFFLGLHHLSNSSPNLKTLRFDTPLFLDKLSHQSVGFPKGLPCPKNIKTLEIEDSTYRDYECHGNSDYSFLLRFPHVENIRVIQVYRDSGFGKHWDLDIGKYRLDRIRIDREIVQVHEFMYEGWMYESNIWKLLPSLKVFSVHSCGKEKIYTRSSYERRRLQVT